MENNLRKDDIKRPLPTKSISIDFGKIEEKNVFCTRKLLYKLAENFFMLLNILLLGLGGYNISDYISDSEYSLSFTLLTISVFMGIVNILYLIYVFKKDQIEIKKPLSIFFYVFLLLNMIYNSCILGEFYRGSIPMEGISILFISISILFDMIKQVYWLCLMQKKYKLFPSAVSNLKPSSLEEKLINSEKKKSQRVVDIV